MADASKAVAKTQEREIAELKTQLAAFKDLDQLSVGAAGIQIKTAGDLHKFARIVVHGEMVPKGMDVKKAFAAMAFGMTIGLTPIQAVQTIAIVNGSPFVWGDGFLGLLYASGQLADIEETYEEETRTARCMMKRVGRDRAVVRTFSYDDAEAAGLLGDSRRQTWIKYFKRMCQMRARRLCGRDLFPDVIGGLNFREDYEEAARIEHERTKDIEVTVSDVDSDSVPQPTRDPEALEEEELEQTTGQLAEALGIDESGEPWGGSTDGQAPPEPEEGEDDGDRGDIQSPS